MRRQKPRDTSAIFVDICSLIRVQFKPSNISEKPKSGCGCTFKLRVNSYKIWASSFPNRWIEMGNRRGMFYDVHAGQRRGASVAPET